MKFCRDVRFYDADMKQIDPPDFETCGPEGFQWFYNKKLYGVYIDGFNALTEWQKVLHSFEDYVYLVDDIVAFTTIGSYIWSKDGNRWLNVRDEISRLTIIDNQLRQ